jgi:hypothetical protein
MSDRKQALSIERLVDFTCNKIEFMSRPRDCDVVYGSTPVVSFGDFTKAKVATIGINPSSLEFMDRSASATSNGLLPEGKKRLADAETLGLISDDPFDDDTVEYVLGSNGATKIWEKCRDYFINPNPYWSWFSDLESVLTGLSVSYKDSTACHLDISPWATDPVFRDLTSEQRERLLLGESDFLEWQIAKSNIDIAVFNGAQVYESLNSLDGFRLENFGEIAYKSGDKKRTSQLYVGSGPGFSRVFGWSMNLQELRVSKEEKTRILEELIIWLSDSTKV